MMRFKGLLLGLALMGSAFAQTSPSGMTVEGTVYQVEPTAVYVMTPDTTFRPLVCSSASRIFCGSALLARLIASTNISVAS